jgi:hypothetical protein
MNQTLVIIAHPNLDTLTVNRYWWEQLQAVEDKLIMHDLYAQYPQRNSDVQLNKNYLKSVAMWLYCFLSTGLIVHVD